MNFPYDLATIGAGNMPEAIVRGVLAARLMPPARIVAVDPDAGRRRLFEQLGVATTSHPTAAAAASRVLLLAVKPQVFRAVAAALAGHIRAEHVLISIMAGVPTDAIEQAFAPRAARVVRVMPNLAMIVGAGMTALCAGVHATAEDLALARRVFESAGRALVLEDESLMNAVTAVSGSGPAYYYLFTEALIAGGRRAGLPEEAARLLAVQTCLGAGRMMTELAEPPEALRAKVTSKGGTTAAALDVLERAGVAEAIAQAVATALRRGRELGSQTPAAQRGQRGKQG